MFCILPELLTDNDNSLSDTQAGTLVSLNTARAFLVPILQMGAQRLDPGSNQVLKVTSRRSWESKLLPDQGSQEWTDTLGQDPLRRFQASETLPLENLGAFYLGHYRAHSEPCSQTNPALGRVRGMRRK